MNAIRLILRWAVPAAILILPAAAAAQAVQEHKAPVDPPPVPYDPQPISDLGLVEFEPGRIALTWTAPLFARGRAASYDLRMAGSPITTANWHQARSVGGKFPEVEPGSPEYWDAPIDPPLDETGTYYFALSYYIEYTEWHEGDPLWSDASNNVEVELDLTAPSAVGDLEVTDAASTSLTLQWTATGDNGEGGGPASYTDLRYSLEEPDGDPEAWWAAATPAPAPLPGEPGTVQMVVVRNLLQGQAYYFRMKVGDEASNWSGLSNVANGMTIPDDGLDHGGDDVSCNASAAGGASAFGLLLGLLSCTLHPRKR